MVDLFNYNLAGALPNQDNQINLHNISILQDKGILTSYEINNLKIVGYTSLESILFTPKMFLNRIIEINEEKYKNICTSGIKLIHNEITKDQFIRYSIKNKEFISTGSKKIDTILGGGIEKGQVTEIYGEFRSGKTQLCHTLSINCQLPGLGGSLNFGGRCIFIDTEKTFRTSRLLSIMKLNDRSIDYLDNIYYIYASNVENQFKYIKQADYIITHSKEKFSLVIIDSLMACFRSEYNNDQIYERQTVLESYVKLMRDLSIKHNVAVVYTNQVGFDILNGRNCNVPIGGKVLDRASTTRLEMNYNENKKERVCKIKGSPYLQESEAKFTIKSIGICDY